MQVTIAIRNFSWVAQERRSRGFFCSGLENDCGIDAPTVVNSLFKAELIRNRGQWKCIDYLEIAVAEYIDLFNRRRLHGEFGHNTPIEKEDIHYSQTPSLDRENGSTEASTKPEAWHFRLPRGVWMIGRSRDGDKSSPCNFVGFQPAL